MTHFPIHTVETAPEGSKPALQNAAKAWGFVSNLHGTLAESPAALEGYEAVFGLMSKTDLTAQEQQIALLTVSVFNECEYCVAGHTYLGTAAKLDRSVIDAIRSGAKIADVRFEALRSFTETVVRTRGFAGDAAINAFLAAGYTKANVLDVVLAVATKTISNYVNHLTHTPAEGFMADPSLGWKAPGNLQAA